MLKFFHIADSHLDSAIASDKKNKTVILDAMEKAFKVAINVCIDESCDALLISGDLFDDDFLSFKTELMLRESFQKLKNRNILVFYCLGNHDSKSSKLRKVKLGDNVHIFDNEAPRGIEIKDTVGNTKGIIFGVGYSTNHVKENLAKRFGEIGIGEHHNVPIVGMLHTSLDVGGDKVYSPCTLDDLYKCKFDYWALGHIHKRNFIGEESPVVFPGCTCGRDFGETGIKGGYLVTLDKRGIPKYEFRELADIAWYDLQVDGFDDVEDAGDMQTVCSKRITDAVDGNKMSFVRLTLKGQCPLYEFFDEDSKNDLQDSIENVTGTNVTVVNKMTSVFNPDEYTDDKHLLSIALEMAKNIKADDNMKMQILDLAEEQYKGLDGSDSKEYFDSLLENIEARLCEVMIKQEH